MHKTVIVEDDPISREALTEIITNHFSELDLVQTFKNKTEAIKGLSEVNADLVLLDVELGDGQCFDLLEELTEIDFEIIITTSHDSFMLEAIKHSAIDYLLKPISRQALEDALKRFYKRKGKQDESEEIKQGNKLVVSNQSGFQLVNIANIIRMESDGPYTMIFTSDGNKMMTSKNLGFYEDKLKAQNFFRVHHSHLINIDHILNYNNKDGGSVRMTDDIMVQVSRRKKEDFLKVFSTEN